MSSVSALIDAIIRVIVNPLIGLLFAVAFLVFLWGGVEFILGSGEAGEAREKGKRHMLWGVIGLFIMFAVFGLLWILARTFGFEDVLTDLKAPLF